MKEIGGQNGLLSETQNTHSNKSTLIPLFLASLSCLCYSVKLKVVVFVSLQYIFAFIQFPKLACKPETD